MSVWTLVVLALGLSMDAFAVSVSNGMCYQNYGRGQAFACAVTFGLFQAGMPLIGYVAGSVFEELITSVDHWIALILLGAIGLGMLIEGIKELKDPVGCQGKKEFSIRTMLMQGIATSIDAFAVGISLAAMRVNLALSVGCIGCITFACCCAGGYLGKKFGGLLQQKARIFGGAILIILGLKIFIEHMFF